MKSYGGRSKWWGPGAASLVRAVRNRGNVSGGDQAAGVIGCVITARAVGVLSDPAATVIVVERRDRLTRFGFEHLQASLASAGRRIVVLDDAETADDLVRDVTEVLTSLCARLYGRRSASRRAAKAVAVATGDEPR